MVLTINSKFRPFSYDEMVKPLVQYKQAYDEVEKDYSTLAAQTEAWKDIATKENNPEAYAMYKKYSDELNALTDDFSKGMNINNRSQLMAMKKRYASEITPIAKADAALKEANKYRDTIYAKDPNAIFYKDRYRSIDDFLHGQVADNSYISGTQVTSRTTARAQAVGTQLYGKYIAQGMKPNEAMAAIQSDPALQAIYNEEWTAANGDTLDDAGKARLQNAIQAGLNNAAAKVAEGEYMTAAQRDASDRGWASLRESKRQHDIALKMKGYDSEGNIDPTNPYWRSQDLVYNPDTGEWTKVAKPGTTKSGASSDGKVPSYKEVITVSRDGTRKIGLAKGETIRGRRVEVGSTATGEYSIKLGGLVLGTYNPSTNTFTGGIKKADRTSESVTKALGHSYDNDIDDLNVQRLLEEIANIATKSGHSSLNNYNFYLDLDNAQGDTNDGSYSIEPLYRAMATSFDGEDDSELENLK